MTTLAALLPSLLDGTVSSGVYELDDATSTSDILDSSGTSNTLDAGTVSEQVTARGWQCFALDGSDVHDKASFLSAIAAACCFPEWFGNNWDALADCLNDLSWASAPGYVLLYDHHAAYASAAEWPMVLDIFGAAARRWARDDVGFFVLLR